MNIDGRAIKSAEEKYEKKKHSRELLRARRLDDTERAIPRISDIDIELKQLGLKTVEIYLDGNNVSEKIDSIRKSSKRLLTERKQLLIKNGYDEDWLDDKYACPKCGDTGYVGSQFCSCLLDLYKKEQENELSE